MTGLAGIAVAASTLAKWVHVMDGNTDAVSNLSTCIEMNKIASNEELNEESDDGDSSARRQSGIEKSCFGTTKATGGRSLWSLEEDVGRLRGKFEVITVCDCLFLLQGVPRRLAARHRPAAH
jgi:hypothetical protein